MLRRNQAKIGHQLPRAAEPGEVADLRHDRYGVAETFRRVMSDKPLWFDHEVCGEGNAHVGIGKEIYYLSGDGLLMPAVKDQPPPDLRYFKKYDR
jgi:hypothetical protein